MCMLYGRFVDVVRRHSVPQASQVRKCERYHEPLSLVSLSYHVLDDRGAHTHHQAGTYRSHDAYSSYVGPVDSFPDSTVLNYVGVDQRRRRILLEHFMSIRVIELHRCHYTCPSHCEYIERDAAVLADGLKYTVQCHVVRVGLETKKKKI